jgi:hypothetical protein
MNPIDYIIIAVVALIVGGAARYIYKAKKRGAKCIGCPSANQCSGQCSGCSCNCSNKK